jgi:hypothetical protein
MNGCARSCLYMIAEQLVGAMVSDLRERFDTYDEDDESD